MADVDANVQDYPRLVSEGKLRGYWLLAPGVFQPPCGFAPADDGWACRLPRGHDGAHYMERDDRGPQSSASPAVGSEPDTQEGSNGGRDA